MSKCKPQPPAEIEEIRPSLQIVRVIDHASDKLSALYALAVAIGNDINPDEADQRTPTEHHHTLICFLSDELKALRERLSDDLHAIVERV